jgi:hypothetical protein
MSNDYRLYHLTNNHIVGAENFEAAGDGEALRYAWTRLRAQAVEVWCGKRRVGFIAAPATDAGGSSARDA